MVRAGATKAPEDRSEAEEILAEGEAQTNAAVDPKAKNKLPEIQVSDVASISCRDDLDRVLAAHQKWIAAVFDPRAEVVGGRANLRGADLRAYDLSGVNLSGADLRDSNLQGVELVRANLTAASLQGAALQTANLRGARLTRAKLEGADLRGADLTDAILIGVDLTQAILRSEDSEVPAEQISAPLVTGAPELPEL